MEAMSEPKAAQAHEAGKAGKAEHKASDVNEAGAAEMARRDSEWPEAAA